MHVSQWHYVLEWSMGAVRVSLPGRCIQRVFRPRKVLGNNDDVETRFLENQGCLQSNDARAIVAISKKHVLGLCVLHHLQRNKTYPSTPIVFGKGAVMMQLVRVLEEMRTV